MMKDSTEDEMKGKIHLVKGDVKEAIGEMVDNPKLEETGHEEDVAGQVQEKIGQIKKVFEK